MMPIPGGNYEMGRSDGSDQSPAHPVEVKDFFLDRYEVTNQQYERFVEATNATPICPAGVEKWARTELDG